MGLGETSIKWRMAAFFQFLGFILVIAGVSSSFISAAEIIPNRERHMGFWDMCDDTLTYGCRDMVEYLNSIKEGSDWVYGCRAMAVLGLILEGLTIVVSIYMAYMASGMNIGNFITGIADFASVVICLIGGLVFLVNSQNILESTLEMDAYPSWSFAVFMMGQGLFLLAGVLQIFEACTAQ